MEHECICWTERASVWRSSQRKRGHWERACLLTSETNALFMPGMRKDTLSLRNERQSKPEGRSMARSTLYPYMASMIFNESPAQIEAQA